MTAQLLTVVQDDYELGRLAAEHIVGAIQLAGTEDRACVIGCPSGRTPKSTYQALARLVQQRDLDMRHVHIAMMDEFVDVDVSGKRLVNISPEYPFSCTGYAHREILQVINSAAAPGKEIPGVHLHSPNALDPDAYEQWLRSTGIDVFILASGGRDGHVAFNGPGTTRSATTRIVKLAEHTRRDNVDTFPSFGNMNNVPEFGVTVGPATIADLSRSAVMLIHGAHKQDAVARISSVRRYDPTWPATIIWECQNPSIIIDEAASMSGHSASAR